MAKSATPGEMRTRIRILKPIDNPDSKRYRNPEYVNIYPDGRTIRCKWVSLFGAESVQAYSLRLTDPATVSLRYDPRITSDCIVEKLPIGKEDPFTNPPVRYEIITAPNDVGGAHRWMEFKVTRKVVSV